ncbi:MAG: hypothetical protein EAZ31_11325 [Cytophagia bacterium]|nr:MAG: hypothetical protein EAZ31_11325 [Cytophagia bacterium]
MATNKKSLNSRSEKALKVSKWGMSGSRSNPVAPTDKIQSLIQSIRLFYSTEMEAEKFTFYILQSDFLIRFYIGYKSIDLNDRLKKYN